MVKQNSEKKSLIYNAFLNLDAQIKTGSELFQIPAYFVFSILRRICWQKSNFCHIKIAVGNAVPSKLSKLERKQQEENYTIFIVVEIGILFQVNFAPI